MRSLVIEDMKRTFRLAQIENEGNDPAKSGKSYGTPHDLASLYGAGRYGKNDTSVPKGYDEKKPVGRPQEKASIANTQDDPLGKDRLGSIENSTVYTANIPNESGAYRGGSPISFAESIRYKNMLKDIPRADKQIIFESQQESSLLDEKNIKDI
jgi:hypothetical protein